MAAEFGHCRTEGAFRDHLPSRGDQGDSELQTRLRRSRRTGVDAQRILRREDPKAPRQHRSGEGTFSRGICCARERGQTLKRTEPKANSTSNFEIVNSNGAVESAEFDFGSANRLLADAAKAAKAAGLGWNDQDLLLKPQPKLVQLVAASRELALQGKAEEEIDAETSGA